MSQTVLLLLQYKYLILFPLACVEGPIVSLAAGFLVYTKVLNPFIAYVVLVLGDFVPDTIIYFIGRLGDHKKIIQKYGEKIKMIKGGFRTVEHLWTHHPRKTTIFAKITFGMSLPFLLSAGLFRIPYKRFISYTLPVSFIQCATVLTIGYFVGKSYEIATSYLQYGYLIVSAVFLIILAIYIHLINRYSKIEIEKIKNEKDL
jgi:membrane protein DedA with SNARE-associated domain